MELHFPIVHNQPPTIQTQKLAKNIDSLKLLNLKGTAGYNGMVIDFMRTGKLSTAPARDLIGSQFLFRYRLVDELAASLGIGEPSTVSFSKSDRAPDLTSRSQKLINNMIGWGVNIDKVIEAQAQSKMYRSAPRSMFLGGEPAELTPQQSNFKASLDSLFKAGMYRVKAQFDYFRHNVHCIEFMIRWMAMVSGAPGDI